MLICFAFLACDQKAKSKTSSETIIYTQLTAERNYWDSIPGKLKVRDKCRPYRYFLEGNPYTGKVEDHFTSGKPKLSGAFKDGYAEGFWKYYQQNDSLEQTGAFENGYVNGEWRFYNRKGKEDTRLFYKRSGRDVSADTLMVVYEDGSRKEWLKDKIICSYRNGNRKYEISADGSDGTFWDINGAVTAEMKDYIRKDKITDETTFYIAQGKHQKAYKELLDYRKTKWTREQKESFETANSVTIKPRFPFSPIIIGFQVTVERSTIKK